MNFTYFVTFSLLMVLIVNNGQCASISAAQLVDDKANSSIVLNYRFVSDWEDFVLLNVNATETGPKQIESCSLSLQSQHGVNDKLYWSSAFDYAVIHSSRIESENKIVFNVLVKNVKPSPNYRFTASCRHLDGMMSVADDLDFELESVLPIDSMFAKRTVDIETSSLIIHNYQIDAAQPVDNKADSSIVLNYRYVEDWEDFVLLNVNATKTGPKQIESCSLSLQSQHDVKGKLYWSSAFDYAVIHSSRLESENKIVFSVLVKDVKPSPNYRITAVCKHSDGILTMADNLDFNMDSKAQ